MPAIKGYSAAIEANSFSVRARSEATESEGKPPLGIVGYILHTAFGQQKNSGKRGGNDQENCKQCGRKPPRAAKRNYRKTGRQRPTVHGRDNQ